MKRNEIKPPKGSRILLRRSRAAHNRWLVLNMELFNLSGGWSQLLARQQVQQLNT